MKRTITVLQDDIDQGCPRAPENCAIARAATRDLADLFADLLGENLRVGVAVGHLNVWAGSWQLVYTADLPVEARSFIACFDQGLPVEPFKFEIELLPYQGRE